MSVLGAKTNAIFCATSSKPGDISLGFRITQGSEKIGWSTLRQAAVGAGLPCRSSFRQQGLNPFTFASKPYVADKIPRVGTAGVDHARLHSPFTNEAHGG